MFDNDYSKISLQILRPSHRDSNQRGLIEAFTAPLNFLNDRFRRFRESVDYIQQHDSRKIHIEKVLNDQFDNVSRRIYIDNVQPVDKLYFYESGDDKTVHFYEPADNKPVYFYERERIDVRNLNFVVNLPIAIQPSTVAALLNLEVRINSQIDRYKVASKNHTLLWIN